MEHSPCLLVLESRQRTCGTTLDGCRSAWRANSGAAASSERLRDPSKIEGRCSRGLLC